MKKAGSIILFVFILVAFYFINHAFGFFEIPNEMKFDMWMHLIGAALIILGGINIYRKVHKK